MRPVPSSAKADTGPLGSRAGGFCACSGSPDRAEPSGTLHIGARGIAFHVLNGVGIPEKSLSRLNTRPTHSPVNASPPPSRSTMHDSGQCRPLGLSPTRLSHATYLPLSPSSHTHIK